MTTSAQPRTDAIADMTSLGSDVAGLLSRTRKTPKPGEFDTTPTGIAADKARVPQLEQAMGDIPQMRQRAQEAFLKGTQAKTEQEAEATAEAAKRKREGLEKIYQAPEVQQQTIEFKPTRMEMEDYKALAGLLVGAAAVFGAGGKNAAMYALSALDGMMSGYNKGRADLFKQQSIEFDKAMKVIQEKNKQALDSLTRMKENLVAKTDEFLAERKQEIAKNSGGILAAQLQMNNIQAAEDTIKNQQTAIEKRLKSYEDAKLRAEQKEQELAERKRHNLMMEALGSRRADISEKKGGKTATSALLAGRAENIREAFAQAAADIVNITKFPPGTMLGALSGLTGSSGDTLIKGIRNSIARQVSPVEQRMLQQLVAGIEGHLAFALGGGYATSQSKARMDQYKEQIARSGDSPENAALFLARLKQEMNILAENFASKPGATEEMNEAVQKYNARIGQAVPFDVDDVIQATLGKSEAKSPESTKPSGGWTVKERK